MFVSTDLEELIALADRIVVLRDGRIDQELDARRGSSPEHLLAAIQTRSAQETPLMSSLPRSDCAPGGPKVSPLRALGIGRFALLLTLVAIIIVTAIGNPRFFSPGNLLNILFQVSALGIVAAGQTILLVAGGLDLSVGAALSVAGLATALDNHRHRLGRRSARWRASSPAR